jgi:hypothetical protein
MLNKVPVIAASNATNFECLAIADVIAAKVVPSQCFVLARAVAL